MSEIDLEKSLRVARAAARIGGAVMESVAATGFDIRKKGRIDLVTRADVEAERAIIERIREDFPDQSILAEESGESVGDEKARWVIDPIDGTTNFAHRFPVYCSSVALEIGGELLVGAIYDPTRDELFSAARGCGAWLDEREIMVSESGKIVDSLLATGFPYRIRELRHTNIAEFKKLSTLAQAIRRPGSAALDLAYVAVGRLDGFWEYHLNPWDIAAGALLIVEAGGKLTDIDGAPFDLHGSSVVASNGIIHEELLAALKSARRGKWSG